MKDYEGCGLCFIDEDSNERYCYYTHKTCDKETCYLKKEHPDIDPSTFHYYHKEDEGPISLTIGVGDMILNHNNIKELETWEHITPDGEKITSLYIQFNN